MYTSNIYKHRFICVNKDMSLQFINQNVKGSLTELVIHNPNNPDQEQDKSSDIEKQPPFGDRKYSKTLPQKREGNKKQREHHII